MKNSTAVNETLCKATGLLIRDLRLREEFYQRPFLTTVAPVEMRLRGYFYSVAVCHQTYHLQNAALGLFGWDYLEKVFTQLVQDQDPLLEAGNLNNFSKDELALKLAMLFSPDGKPENTTLDRLEERAQMLKELDEFVSAKFSSSLAHLMETTRSRLMNEDKGFYEILSASSAFSDPMKKKITFLLKLLEEAGMVNIIDKQNFIPIMDYHMQRVLLRIGCVEVTDPYLHASLINHVSLESDEEIRSACIEAFRIIAGISGHAVTKLNDFFWSLGRSCCNVQPLCQFHRCEKEPCTFFQIVDLKEHKDCLFTHVCLGFTHEKYRKLWQPVVVTHYY